MPRVLPVIREGRPPRRFERKPSWLKVRAPGGERYARLRSVCRDLDLHTVCEEARCPNLGECWNGGTATLMLLGEVCTRGCRFCNVQTSRTPPAPDPKEPEKVAHAVAALELDYVVLTMVDRDDLNDGGARHVADTVRAIKASAPEVLVELLTGDFQGDEAALREIASCGADVLAHNVETVQRLQAEARDARCSYALSLGVLERFKALAPATFTKSSLMLGLGETEDELTEAFVDLRARGVDILTLGQYLRPSEWHLPVREYVAPATFERLEARALEAGFRFCAAGPLVRSSYRAGELFVKNVRSGREEVPRGCDRS